MTEKIDIHNDQKSYKKAQQILHTDTTICPENKQHIQRFLRDCELGKTIQGRQKKKLSKKRLMKHLYTLRMINHWLGNKDFKTISQREMEEFITRLENNQLTNKGKVKEYSLASQRDIKLCVRKLYTWLLGKGRGTPDLVNWIDTSIENRSPPCLSLEEIRKLADYTPTTRGKALVWTLFETGARADEFLNIRFGHVEVKESHVAVRIEFPKTFKRSLPVFEGANHLKNWLEENAKQSGDALLFPIGYDALRMFLNRLGRRALGKRVHPHLIRHSFATWLATKKVGRYQMCKLLGWAMSSDMPDRYIDRTGVVEEEAIQAIREDDLTKAERENNELRATLKRLEAQSNEMKEQLEQRTKIDTFLSKILKDEKMAGLFTQRVKEKGLGKFLVDL